MVRHRALHHYRSLLSPGAMIVPLAVAQGSVLDIVVDTKNIYWTSLGGANGVGGAIQQLGK